MAEHVVIIQLLLVGHSVPAAPRPWNGKGQSSYPNWVKLLFVRQLVIVHVCNDQLGCRSI